MHVPALFRAAALLPLGLLCLVADARADVVRFTSGQTIRVERARVEGDIVVLVMRDGSEIRTLKSVVLDITPNPVASASAAATPTSGRLRALVDRVATRLGVDTRLAHAVVALESNYDPLAVSHRGAMGLMQITWAVAHAYAVVDPFDPEQNLEAGLRHLTRLIRRFDVPHALAAYNAGERAVMRHGGVPPYPETQAYVRRILAALQ